MDYVIIGNEYYQISDEEILPGDWVYNPYGNFIGLAIGDTYWFSAGFYKVIGSTKKINGLTQLSKTQFKNYNCIGVYN